MKIAKFRFGRMATAGALVAGSLFAGQAALACTTGNWSGTMGSVAAGARIADGIERYSGLCGMQTPGGAVAYVQDDNPGGIRRIRARFYVLADNTSAVDIYRGFTAGSSQLFNVRLGTGGAVTLTSGGASVSANGVSGNWNSIEVDWNASSGQLVLTVNEQSPVSVPFSVSGGVGFVRLGNLNGASGTMNFDAYESRRTTGVGRLLVGDVNGNGSISSADVVAARLEFLGTEQPGQPDCNESGSISSADVVCTRLVFLSSP